jgi:hypothetical protein
MRWVLVSYISRWVTGDFPSLMNAKLKGILGDSSAPIELNLTDYVETASYTFDTDPSTKQPSDSKIQESLHSLVDSKKGTND